MKRERLASLKVRTNTHHMDLANYTKNNIPLYKSLVHPDDAALHRAAAQLAAQLVKLLPNKEQWRILDLGIGGAWTTAALLKALMDLANVPQTIEFVAIDQNSEMVETAKQTLASALSPNSMKGRELTISVTQRRFEDYCDPSEFDVILALFFLHHLDCQWHAGLQKIARLLAPQGILVLCESSGDIGAWSYCFDKVDLLKDQAPARLHALGVARRFQRECERVGWHNRRMLAASNVRAALDVLESFGWKPECKIEEPYNSTYTLGQWLEAGDLEHGKARGFTVFPPDLSEERRRELYDAVRSEIDSRSLTLNTEVQGHHTLCFYALRPGPAPAAMQTRLREATATFLRSRFSELRVAREPDDYFAIWRNDLVALWHAAVVDGPRLFLTVHWDVLDGCWHEDAPFVAKDAGVLKRTMLYFAATGAYLGEYKISTAIFTSLPEKTRFQTQYTPSGEFSVDVVLGPDGHIDKLKFRVPRSLLTVEFQQLCDTVSNKIELPSDLKPDDAALSGTFIASTRTLVAESGKYKQALRQVSNGSPFVEAAISTAVKQLEAALHAVSCFTGNRLWDFEPLSQENLVKALVLGSVVNEPEIWHLPSRDYVHSPSVGEETSGASKRGYGSQFHENSAGGLIVFLQHSDSRIDCETITDCLNLRNRSLYAYQHRLKALLEAQRAARAAIMARNMSHNIGSHVAPRSTLDRVIDRMKKLGYHLKTGEILKTVTLLKTRLDDYLQRKADFIAEISSEPLTSTKNASFYREVVAPLVTNTLLMDNICRNEELGYIDPSINKLRIRVFLPSQRGDSGQSQHVEVKGLFSCSTGNSGDYIYPDQYPYSGYCLNTQHQQPRAGAVNHYSGDPEAQLQLVAVREVKRNEGGNEEPEDEKDITVALPGPLGEYALYGFLENFLRNAAKHNKEKLTKAETLEVTLAVADPQGDSDFYELSVWDNVSEPNREFDSKDQEGQAQTLLTKIAALLRQDLIHEDGRLRREAWGLAEMKIAAALLGGDWRFTRLDQALTVESEKRDGQERLVFKLKLMKPKRIYALSAATVSPDLKAQGVIVVQSLTELKDYLAQRKSPASAEFFVLDLHVARQGPNSLPDDNWLEDLIDLLYMLPFRLLCAIPDGVTLPASLAVLKAQRRLVVVSEQPPWGKTAAELERWAWRNWLRRWFKDGTPAQDYTVSVNVFLNQKEGEEPTGSWKTFAEEHDAYEGGTEQPKVKLRVLHLGSEAQSASETGEVCQVFYDRHGGAVGNHTINLKNDAYIWFDKLSPDFVRVFRRDPPILLPYQLAEAGLLRVLVIDERIAELAGRDPGLSQTDNKKLGQILGLGEDGAMAWHIAYAARVLVCTSLTWVGALETRRYADKDLCQVTVDSNQITCKCQVGSVSQSFSKDSIDVCIIHQGILDDLKSTTPEKALKHLGDLVPFVIVDSGRGIPPGLPQTQKFLPFSLLDDWIGQRTGKLVLSQLLMQLTRRADQFT